MAKKKKKKVIIEDEKKPTDNKKILKITIICVILFGIICLLWARFISTSGLIIKEYPIYTTELGKYIYEAREKAGISQRQLAKLSKMDCAEVSRIEAGKRQKPNVLFLKGIAETLNLSLVKLMELAGYNDIDIIVFYGLTQIEEKEK